MILDSAARLYKMLYLVASQCFNCYSNQLLKDACDHLYDYSGKIMNFKIEIAHLNLFLEVRFKARFKSVYPDQSTFRDY